MCHTCCTVDTVVGCLNFAEACRDFSLASIRFGHSSHCPVGNHAEGILLPALRAVLLRTSSPMMAKAIARLAQTSAPGQLLLASLLSEMQRTDEDQWRSTVW